MKKHFDRLFVGFCGAAIIFFVAATVSACFVVVIRGLAIPIAMGITKLFNYFGTKYPICTLNLLDKVNMCIALFVVLGGLYFLGKSIMGDNK